MSKAAGVLYISYDGMLEPLGQSQVLGYLRHLAMDRPIHLISFEKQEDWKHTSVRQELARQIQASGIVWHPLRYHKRPTALATALDILSGTVLGLWLVLRFRLRLVHARSYVSSVMALAIKRIASVKFLFDMRGFWADERVDGNLWSRSGRMYRVAKAFERRFLLEADEVVALTHAAVTEMQTFPYLKSRGLRTTVIPTCADLGRFRPVHSKTGSGTFVLGYVGSAGTWYLFDEVALCFAQLREVRPDATLVILNRGQHSYIRERLANAGIAESAFELKAADHSEVPAEMARMDAGIFFYKPSYSRVACAPTKLGEFLGCGLPCLVNEGVGDMADVLKADSIGVALSSLDPASLRAGAERLLALAADPATSSRCLQAAIRHFSLDQGVARYRHIYERLAK